MGEKKYHLKPEQNKPGTLQSQYSEQGIIGRLHFLPDFLMPVPADREKRQDSAWRKLQSTVRQLLVEIEAGKQVTKNVNWRHYLNSAKNGLF